jgi:transposase
LRGQSVIGKVEKFGSPTWNENRVLPAYSPDFNSIEKDWANMKNALVDSLLDYSDVTSAVYNYFEVNTSFS